ncbi:MAG TPA: hypothetical protein VGJ94_05575 [Syntrophorhabdaceae bacterium]|jgi:hypothetical protein
MKIIVDIDNTLWDFAPVLYDYLKETGPGIPPIEKWGAWKFWEGEMSSRTFYTILRRLHMDQEKFEPYADASWFLNSLRERGFHILIASHREKDTYEPTARWLRKFNLYFDELHVLSDKAKLFEGVFGIVDDSPITLAKAARAGIVATGLLFPWNEGLGYDLFRSLREILEYIDLMSSRNYREPSRGSVDVQAPSRFINTVDHKEVSSKDGE